jgi:hypothetical protein
MLLLLDLFRDCDRNEDDMLSLEYPKLLYVDDDPPVEGLDLLPLPLLLPY